MKFFDLLVLMGVDPDARPAKAIAWFIAVMAIGALLMLLGAVLALDTGNEWWIPLVLLVFGTGFFVSGKMLGILDDGKKRSGLKDAGKFVAAMLSHGWDTQQPTSKIVAWILGSMLVFIGLSHFLVRKMMETGETGWFYLTFPAAFVIIVIVRHFGPTK